MASVLSALGCLFAGFSFESMQTHLILLEEFDRDLVESIFKNLQDKVSDKIIKEGILEEDIVLFRFLDMRYKGQSYELTIPYTLNLKNDFEKEHLKSYGFILENPIEIVNFRVKGMSTPPEISLFYHEDRGDPLVGEREVWIDQWQKVPIFRKENIFVGWKERGPLLIECKDTNILVPAGNVEMDSNGIIFIKIR